MPICKWALASASGSVICRSALAPAKTALDVLSSVADYPADLLETWLSWWTTAS